MELGLEAGQEWNHGESEVAEEVAASRDVLVIYTFSDSLLRDCEVAISLLRVDNYSPLEQQSPRRAAMMSV